MKSTYNDLLTCKRNDRYERGVVVTERFYTHYDIADKDFGRYKRGL